MEKKCKCAADYPPSYAQATLKKTKHSKINERAKKNTHEQPFLMGKRFDVH